MKEGPWHLVEAHWYCDCADVECCRTELYVSDIRILRSELDALKRAIAASWNRTSQTIRSTE